MEFYLKSVDYDIWYIVMHGDIIPKKKVGDIFFDKVHKELDDKDKIMLSKNAKAKNFLICGLDRNMSNSVDQASNAHDMWKILEIYHQGTSSMKETKINILVQQYEMFKMHRNETIVQMFVRFNSITNDLYTLGKSYTSIELVKKS